MTGSTNESTSLETFTIEEVEFLLAIFVDVLAQQDSHDDTLGSTLANLDLIALAISKFQRFHRGITIFDQIFDLVFDLGNILADFAGFTDTFRQFYISFDLVTGNIQECLIQTFANEEAVHKAATLLGLDFTGSNQATSIGFLGFTLAIFKGVFFANVQHFGGFCLSQFFTQLRQQVRQVFDFLVDLFNVHFQSL